MLPGAGGCNQTLTLKLAVLDTAYTWLKLNINEGEIYAENNFRAWMSGVYTQRWVSPTGCDSMVVLELTALPLDQDTLYASLCPGETYDAHSFRENRPGCYTHTFKNSWGGDSLVTLVLTQLPSSADTL